MPDKNAAAHRVSANGKIFDSLGYNTVYIGSVSGPERFDGVRQSSFSDKVFEECHPSTNIQWLRRLTGISNITSVAEKYPDTVMIVLYNVPYITLLNVKNHFRRTGIKIVYDCTEWTAETDGSVIKRYYKKIDEWFIRNRIHKTSDGVIVISKMMSDRYGSKSNILRLPPLVDISDPIWNQTPFEHDGKFEFCFAGGLDGNKESLDRIIRAFSSLDTTDKCLRIIGISKEQYRKHYPDCSYSENDGIVFMGRLSHKDTVRYILSCDCYIFIRESDRRNNAGFPTKFAESFTCGVPVITTDVSDIKCYLDGARGIIIDNTDEKNIKDAMVSIIGSNLKKTGVSNRFDYNSYSTATCEWLEKI